MGDSNREIMAIGIRSSIISGLAATMLLFLGPFALAGKAVDPLGRPVSLPDYPERIIALAPNITEIIFALGQQHRLVGATRFSDYPLEATSLPKVGSYIDLDLERIVSLRPDLCVAIKDGNPKAVIDRLEGLSIPVYAVDPRDLESVIDAIRSIGCVLDAGEAAGNLTARLRSRIQRVERQISSTDTRPRVFFQIGVSPIVSIGTKTFIHRLIQKAGGRNVTAGPTPYPRYSREQVIALSPDLMIISDMARSGIFKRVKAEWDQWDDIPAVKNDRIHLVDSNQFNRPTPRLVDALETLIRLIHPELFAEGQ